MKYFLRSILTFSFWRYALLSKDGIASFFATIGACYTMMELFDFFSIYSRENYSHFIVWLILGFALLAVVVSRRPLTRFSYKIPRRDLRIDLKIGDIFEEKGDVVISSNTTFDTNVASGLISADSLQGQLTQKVFQGNTAEIDKQLDSDLIRYSSEIRQDAPGKSNEYAIGTVARVKIPAKTFYFVAMSRLNKQGTASSSLRMVEDALSHLWTFIRTHGEVRPIVMPLIGTGRGRVQLPRKKMVERIAQSFADASKDHIFTNRLIIVIRPEDAENFGVNLFEIRDYLARSLHI